MLFVDVGSFHSSGNQFLVTREVQWPDWHPTRDVFCYCPDHLADLRQHLPLLRCLSIRYLQRSYGGTLLNLQVSVNLRSPQSGRVWGIRFCETHSRLRTHPDRERSTSE